MSHSDTADAEQHAAAALASAEHSLHGGASGLQALEAAAAVVQEGDHSDDQSGLTPEYKGGGGPARDTDGSQGECGAAAGSELAPQASQRVESSGRENDQCAVAYEFASEGRAAEEGDEELEYLRSKVSELETQLEELQQQQGGDAAGTSGSIVAHRLASYVRPLPPNASVSRQGGGVRIEWSSESGWEDIAARQLAERHKAEMENVRLKMMLEGQIKVAKGLQLLIEMRANAQFRRRPAGESTLPATNQQQTTSAPEGEDAEIFTMLLSSLDNAVNEVDAVFAANGLSETETAMQDAKVVSDGPNHQIRLEVFANKLLPFDIHATSEAVWKHFVTMIDRMPYRSYFERKPKMMEATDDTYLETFGVEIQAKRTTARFRVRHAMRRFVEEDRILIAWRETIDPREFSSQPTSGIRFLEKGYILVKRPTTQSPEYSLMQTCFIMTPERFGSEDQDPDNMVGQISSFLVDCVGRNIYLTHQMIENFLMDESLKRK